MAKLAILLSILIENMYAIANGLSIAHYLC